jgi:hypothetical protein
LFEECTVKKFPLFFLFVAGVCSAAQYDASMAEANTYINSAWGKAYVLKNDLCSLAVVPNVGARLMSYCLGSYSFLRVDGGAGLGPYSTGINDNYKGGGFMAWPVPQVNWYGTETWPPPPYLAHGLYTNVVVNNTADSVVMAFTSPQEQLTNAAGLVFRKVYSIYRASSRVKVDIRLINKNSTPKTWSIREVAQVKPSHAGQSDYSNFKAFFPKGSSTADGTKGFWDTDNKLPQEFFSQFTTDNASGVVRFQNNNKAGRIAAHPSQQWLAYQDSLEGYTFIQKGDYQPSGTYPEYNGAVLIMYVGDWLEMELCAPQKNIPANDSLQYVTNWFSTKLSGRICAINDAGAIKDSIAVDPVAGKITGAYGVFYKGTVKIWFNDQPSAAKEIAVTPLTTLTLNETVTIPPTAVYASLLLYNAAGLLVDTLDSKVFRSLPNIGIIAPAMRRGMQGFTVRVSGQKLMVGTPDRGPGRIRLHTLSGKKVAESDYLSGGIHPIDLAKLTPGTYLVTVDSKERYSRQFEVVHR